MTSLRRRLTFSNVVAALALFAALGGGAIAASTIGGGGTIAACYKTSGKSKGLARLVASGARCKHGEQAVAWNQRGPTGPAGPAGAQGAAGAAGTNGINGAKGDTGAPGSTIVARLVGSQETLPSTLSDGSVGFSPNTWNQAAGEDQLVMGVLTVDSATGCSAAHLFEVSLRLDGGTPFDTTIASAPGAEAMLAVPIAVLRPGSSVSHSLTASAGNSCTGSVTFHVDVDIVSFK